MSKEERESMGTVKVVGAAKPEEPKEKAEEKHETKTIEFKLPEEISVLPGKVDEIDTKIANLYKTVEKSKPEEQVPCPTCKNPIPKSRQPEIEERLKKQTPERQIERVVPEVKEITKEVPKYPNEGEWVEIMKKTFPERPGDAQLEALEKLTSEVGKRWHWKEK